MHFLKPKAEILQQHLHGHYLVRQFSSAVDSLACNEILWKSLRIIEDDEHCRLGDVICHAIISEGNFTGLLQRGGLHRMATFSVVSC